MKELPTVFQIVDGRKCFIISDNPDDRLKVLVEYLDNESHHLVSKWDLKVVRGQS